MQTYFITTKLIYGPRGARLVEKWAVSADNEEEAKSIAVASAHTGSVVIESILVPAGNAVRVVIC